MSKRSSASRNRHRDRAARTHVQRKMSPLGCVTWMAIPILCFFLFFLVTVINGAPTSNASSALEQKQQILQHELHEGRAQAQAGPDTPVPTDQTPQPRRAGIINGHQAPFPPSIFTVNNAWQGPVGSQWIIAYAGAQTNPDGTQGQGGLVLYTDGDFALSYLGTFLAPAGTPSLTIIKEQEDLLLLQTASGHMLTFNLQTRQFH